MGIVGRVLTNAANLNYGKVVAAQVCGWVSCNGFFGGGGSTSRLSDLRGEGPLESHDSSPNLGRRGKTGCTAEHRDPVGRSGGGCGLLVGGFVPKVRERRGWVRGVGGQLHP